MKQLRAFNILAILFAILLVSATPAFADDVAAAGAAATGNASASSTTVAAAGGAASAGTAIAGTGTVAAPVAAAPLPGGGTILGLSPSIAVPGVVGVVTLGTGAITSSVSADTNTAHHNP